VTKEVIVVGRQPECDLCLDHKGISKLHCVLIKTDGLLVLRDLGSTNGTRVNGTRVRRAALLPNDKVSFASFHYKVHLGPPDVPLPVGENTEAIAPGAAGAAPAPNTEDSHHSEVKEPKTPEIICNDLPDLYPDAKKK
jgi:predicted component of type VI protein secretion system